MEEEYQVLNRYGSGHRRNDGNYVVEILYVAFYVVLYMICFLVPTTVVLDYGRLMFIVFVVIDLEFFVCFTCQVFTLAKHRRSCILLRTQKTSLCSLLALWSESCFEVC